MPTVDALEQYQLETFTSIGLLPNSFKIQAKNLKKRFRNSIH